VSCLAEGTIGLERIKRASEANGESISGKMRHVDDDGAPIILLPALTGTSDLTTPRSETVVRISKPEFWACHQAQASLSVRLDQGRLVWRYTRPVVV
jgi:hypothetical protein